MVMKIKGRHKRHNRKMPGTMPAERVPNDAAGCCGLVCSKWLKANSSIQLWYSSERYLKTNLNISGRAHSWSWQKFWNIVLTPPVFPTHPVLRHACGIEAGDQTIRQGHGDQHLAALSFKHPPGWAFFRQHHLAISSSCAIYVINFDFCLQFIIFVS